nr:F-box domain, leucine-rich repeat domain, L domain-like protein [Tanacetum cinerariifolium]
MSTEMELVLEQTQQGTSYEVSKDSTARNPVKEILLKLNLPDHRSILTDSKHKFSDSNDDEYSSVDGGGFRKCILYTTSEEDVIIKNLTTHDDFLNRLCSTGGLFRGGVPKQGSSLPNIPEDDPVGSTIEPQFKVKRGTTCRLDVEDTSSSKDFLKRVYICYKRVKDGWLAGCRKCLLTDVADLLPQVEHRKYTRHLYANFKKMFNGV